MDGNTLAALLRDAPARLEQKRVFAGFDGFTDRIIRPIRKIEGETLAYFDTIADFGAFLQQKAEQSCSIELDVRTHKVGGNCPILSAALGACGVSIDCVGMFGGGLFEAQMPPACRLHSYAPCGTADCLEFRDGKVLLASRCTMEGDPFDTVSAAVPDLAALLTQADLACFLNWSELAYAPALWQAVYARVFSPQPVDKTRAVFFDLCDFARKSEGELEAVFRLIGAFGAKRRAVLSMNENECRLAGAHIGCAGTLEEIARALAARYGMDEIVVHTLRRSHVLLDGVWHERPTIFCEKPLLSTGAGDNFNAGYCLGILLETDAAGCLALANLFASRYITTGGNADCGALAAYAET